MSDTVKLGNRTLAYQFNGPASAPVVVFANSLGADMTMWEENVPAFSSRYRMLRYDMRGHGGSSTAPGDCTPALLADDVVMLLDALDVQRVHFVGLSLGGIVGQQLGARHGQRLLSLTLCDTMSKQAVPEMWAARIVQVREHGLKPITQGTIERWFTPAFVRDNPSRISEIEQMILRTAPEGYARCAVAVQSLDQTDILSAISTPTLVLTGEQDAAAPPEVATRMADAIVGARLKIIPGGAHLPNIEKTAAFDASVLAFIDAVGGTAL